jgi:S-adenosylmethionine decarboxylase
VWPVTLVLATFGYVMAWIVWSDHGSVAADRRVLRFGLFAAGGFAVYAASLPWAFQSAALVDVGAWTTSAGSRVLSMLGVSAQSTSNVLFTGRGSFKVTPECLFTPMIPLYVAALWALPMSRGWRMGYLLLSGPLFFGLGVARLLVLTVPLFVGESALHVAHGFYQLLAGSVLLIGAAHWATRRDPSARSSWTSVWVLGATLAVGLVAAAPWRSVVQWAADGVANRFHIAPLPLVSASDQQGALALMPGYQLAVACGLWLALTSGRAWRALGVGLGWLLGSQIGFIVGAAAVHAQWGVMPHAIIVRGWALGVPAIVALFWNSAPTAAGLAVRSTGVEHVVDAYGCDPAALRSPDILRALVRDVVESLGLTPVSAPMWHAFPGEGGVTGLTMLAESHLSVHTYPERGFAAFDLYCCRPHVEWPWKEKLASALGARDVNVRVIQRGERLGATTHDGVPPE